MDNNKGFTLIELLVVVVIIGILAGLAIPRFSEARERAFRSSMMSDLRNVQTLQEQYYFDNNYQYFTGSLSHETGFNADLGFRPSDRVEISIAPFGDGGYEAVATHDSEAMNGFSCTLRVSDSDQVLSCESSQ